MLSRGRYAGRIFGTVVNFRPRYVHSVMCETNTVLHVVTDEGIPRRWCLGSTKKIDEET